MEKLNIFLKDFQPLYNTQPLPQTEVLDYTAWLLATAQCSKNGVESEAEAEKIFQKMQTEVHRYGVSPQYIKQRELNSLAGVYSYPEKKFLTDKFPEIFSNILENYEGQDLYTRLALYEKLVYKLMQEWYQNVTVLPDDIIHATCTGYLSPSPIQELLSNKGWGDITVTHSYQMGCYGAIPPLRMAMGFLAASYTTLPKPKKQIDILHTEYSSLHFQAINSLPDQIVSMTLFADGFMKYSVFIEDANTPHSKGLKILTTQDKIVSATVDEMTLIPGPFGFDMWLSKNVPLKIREGIYEFVVSLCAQMGLNFNKLKEELIFALHPGGPKILDHIRDRLGLDEKQIRFSRKVLLEHGNMVSATLPYIWKEIIEDDSIAVGTKIVSVGFGPGLTIAGFLLEKI